MNYRVIDMLKRLAIESPGVSERRLSAGVVYKKRLIATGVNSWKTHPLMCEKNGYREGQIFLHAEVDAIKNALRLITQDDLTKCDLYVYRAKRPHPHSTKWIQGLAKPCDGCAMTIATFGVNNVIYSTDYDGIFEVL